MTSSKPAPLRAVAFEGSQLAPDGDWVRTR